MNWIRRLRVWWDDLGWMGEAEEFIDNFLDVYAASGGPRPMIKRQSGETMREYRARFVEWLTMPSTHPNWASDRRVISSEAARV